MEHAHAIGARLFERAGRPEVADGRNSRSAARRLLRARPRRVDARHLPAHRPGTGGRCRDPLLARGRTTKSWLGMARRCEVDLAFVQLPVPHDDVEVVTLLEDNYVQVVVRAGSVDSRNADAGATGRDVADRLQDRQGVPAHRLLPLEQSRADVVGRLSRHRDDLRVRPPQAAGDGVALLPRLATNSASAPASTSSASSPAACPRDGSALRGRRRVVSRVWRDAFVRAATAEAGRLQEQRLAVAS